MLRQRDLRRCKIALFCAARESAWPLQSLRSCIRVSPRRWRHSRSSCSCRALLVRRCSRVMSLRRRSRTPTTVRSSACEQSCSRTCLPRPPSLRGIRRGKPCGRMRIAVLPRRSWVATVRHQCSCVRADAKRRRSICVAPKAASCRHGAEAATSCSSPCVLSAPTEGAAEVGEARDASGARASEQAISIGNTGLFIPTDNFRPIRDRSR